jgi:hypothetical protein
MGTTWRVRNGNRKVLGGSGRVVPTTEDLKESRSRTSSRASPSLGTSASQQPSNTLPPNPATSDPNRHASADGAKYIAPEIVVWTEATDADAMSVDSPRSPSPAPELEPEVGPEQDLEAESEVKSEAESDHVAYVHPMAGFPNLHIRQWSPVKLTECQLILTSAVARAPSDARSPSDARPSTVTTTCLTTNHSSHQSPSSCSSSVVVFRLVALSYIGTFRLVIGPGISIEQGDHPGRYRQL